jgi:hypothetical protein
MAMWLVEIGDEFDLELNELPLEVQVELAAGSMRTSSA